MVPQLFQDIRQLATGKLPIVSERMVMSTFWLSALVIVVTLIVLLSSYRPIPTRVAPGILPVTQLVTVTEPALQILPVVAVIAPPAPVVPVNDVVEYRVQRGDTLGAIGRQYCFDYLTIARENGITDPNWIYAGKTVLKFKNGCLGNAPSVLVKQSVSPRELVSNGGASSGKHISSLVPRDTEAQTLPPVAAPLPTASASQPTQAAALATDETQPLSTVRHREIYRIVALRNMGSERTRAQDAELARLTALIRREVLERYDLPNPDCLYASAKQAGKTYREQLLYRVHCIRENYGEVIDEVAAKSAKFDAAYFEALLLIESGGQPDAISPTGCTGVKQFCLRSAKSFALSDRFDPFESIRAGARHLEANLQQWGGDVAKATAHYGIGPVIVGRPGFNAAEFPYTRSVLRMQRLIEKEIQRTASGQPGLVSVSYTPAHRSKP